MLPRTPVQPLIDLLMRDLSVEVRTQLGHALAVRKLAKRLTGRPGLQVCNGADLNVPEGQKTLEFRLKTKLFRLVNSKAAPTSKSLRGWIGILMTLAPHDMESRAREICAINILREALPLDEPLPGLTPEECLALNRFAGNEAPHAEQFAHDPSPGETSRVFALFSRLPPGMTEAQQRYCLDVCEAIGKRLAGCGCALLNASKSTVTVRACCDAFAASIPADQRRSRMTTHSYDLVEVDERNCAWQRVEYGEVRCHPTRAVGRRFDLLADSDVVVILGGTCLTREYQPLIHSLGIPCVPVPVAGGVAQVEHQYQLEDAVMKGARRFQGILQRLSDAKATPMSIADAVADGVELLASWRRERAPAVAACRSPRSRPLP